MPPHRAEVAHHVRGRIRVKLAQAKGNPVLLENIRRRLSTMDGVSQVDVSASTGSVVVHYDARHHDDFHGALTRQAENEGLFALELPALTEVDLAAQKIQEEAEFLAQRSELARVIVDSVKTLNRKVRRATNNNLDLNVLLPLALAAYTFIEHEPEVGTPLWVTLSIFSFNSFIILHRPDPAHAVNRTVETDITVTSQSAAGQRSS